MQFMHTFSSNVSLMFIVDNTWLYLMKFYYQYALTLTLFCSLDNFNKHVMDLLNFSNFDKVCLC